MEWDGTRTENIFNSVSLDSIKNSIGRYCLDDGIGIYDAARTSNKETANKDIAQAKDQALIKAICSSPKHDAAKKMK